MLYHYKNHIKVDELHTLYVERIGDVDKPTILFIHGGPGIGFSDMDRDFFNYQSCNVILYDQRGCKRSIPQGSIQKNTTEDQVSDINHILDYFKVDNVILFGGSWGSTLSLVYALSYPTKVSQILLRGLFLGCQESREHFEKGGNQNLFPKEWNRFKSKIGELDDAKVMDRYLEQILLSPENINKLSLELNLYGHSINSPQADRKTLETTIIESNHLTQSVLLAHYSKNNFFIEDKWIENHLNGISNIPVTIVHGSNDKITLSKFPKRIVVKHHNIRLIETKDGHSAHTPENKKVILNVLAEILKAYSSIILHSPLTVN